jgi:hypothetical protein
MQFGLLKPKSTGSEFSKEYKKGAVSPHISQRGWEVGMWDVGRGT